MTDTMGLCQPCVDVCWQFLSWRVGGCAYPAKRPCAACGGRWLGRIMAEYPPDVAAPPRQRPQPAAPDLFEVVR